MCKVNKRLLVSKNCTKRSFEMESSRIKAAKFLGRNARSVLTRKITMV
jgi:hypothetical protein